MYLKLKEFATYELLGMEVGTIQKLFLLEKYLSSSTWV